MKNVTIDIPKGYEIDEEKSTFTNIVFKEISSSWSRDKHFPGGSVNYYYYLIRDSSCGFASAFQTLGLNTAPKVHTYETREEAENAAHKFNTLQLMESWVKHHNKIDKFVPDWRDNTLKYGIVCNYGEYSADYFMVANAFVFQLCVKTKIRAEGLLEEFKDDLEKIVW